MASSSRAPRRPRALVLAAAAAVAATLVPRPAVAGDTWSTPHPGVRHLYRTTSRPWRIHALVVDLCAPGVSLRATKSSERRRTVPSFADLVGAEAAVNADFFSFSDYSTSGLSIGNGERWADTSDGSGSGFVAFGSDRAEVSWPSEVVATPPAWMKQVVSGHPGIVRDGTVITGFSGMCAERHPRTAAGLSADGRSLVLAVVDGRSSISIGMTCSELGSLMKELGARQAINLDGGGSTTMWIRGSGVVNKPSDGTPRVVANHLAIQAGGSGIPGSCPDGRTEVMLQGAVLESGGTSDLDGDGRADACARAAAGVRCARGGDGGFSAVLEGPALTNDDGWRDPANFSTLRMGDVNGDGRADLCARSDAGIRCWPSTGAGFGAGVDGPALSDASGWGELQYYGTIKLADFDGDGRDDLCARAAAGFGCYPALAGGGFGPRVAGPTLSDASGWADVSNYGTIRMGDVDGDGRADVCARANAGMRCWLSDGAGFPTAIDGPPWSDESGWGWPRFWATIRLHDMDGDGRADLCARSASDFRCHLSLGQSFGPAIVGPALADSSGWNDYDNWSTIRLGDIDGDGTSDVCARANAGIRCWTFDGAAFSASLNGPELSDASGWSADDHHRTIRLADVSGDGLADLCARAAAGLSCWVSDGAGFPTRIDGPRWSDEDGWDAMAHYTTLRLDRPRCTPAVEVCNGVDDDCDREVDEGCLPPDAGPPPPGIDATDVDPPPVDPTGDGGSALGDGGGPGVDDPAGGCGCGTTRRAPGPAAWVALAALALAGRRHRRLRGR